MRATCELQTIRAPTTTHQHWHILLYMHTLCRFTFRSIFRNIIIYDNAQSIVKNKKKNTY